MKRLVFVWLALQEWDRLALRPFTNRERLAELEAAIGLVLFEAVRR